MLNNINNTVRKFHDDEAGLEALQVVMILAIAAVALIAVKTQWETISTWFKEMMEQGTGESNWVQP